MYFINSTINYFITNLSTSLTDSNKFKLRAFIARTWNIILTPGSTSEFNLNTHFGGEINLNTVHDLFQTSIFYNQNISRLVNKVSQTVYENNWSNSTATKDYKKIVSDSFNEYDSAYGSKHPVSYTICSDYLGYRGASVQ